MASDPNLIRSILARADIISRSGTQSANQIYDAVSSVGQGIAQGASAFMQRREQVKDRARVEEDIQLINDAARSGGLRAVINARVRTPQGQAAKQATLQSFAQLRTAQARDMSAQASLLSSQASMANALKPDEPTRSPLYRESKDWVDTAFAGKDIPDDVREQLIGRRMAELEKLEQEQWERRNLTEFRQKKELAEFANGLRVDLEKALMPVKQMYEEWQMKQEFDQFVKEETVRQKGRKELQEGQQEHALAMQEKREEFQRTLFDETHKFDTAKEARNWLGLLVETMNLMSDVPESLKVKILDKANALLEGDLDDTQITSGINDLVPDVKAALVPAAEKAAREAFAAWKADPENMEKKQEADRLILEWKRLKNE